MFKGTLQRPNWPRHIQTLAATTTTTTAAAAVTAATTTKIEWQRFHFKSESLHL